MGLGKSLRRAARNIRSGVSDAFQGSTYAQFGRDIERDAQMYVANPEAAIARGAMFAAGPMGTSELLIAGSRALGQSGVVQGVLGKGADPYAYAVEAGQKSASKIGVGNQPGAPTGDEPPGYNYENDPNFQQQFSRLRKAARVLGRAGTYRNRGASSLGTDSPLGTPMQLTGA